MSISPAQALSGWLWNGKRLVHDDTVDGCLARRVVFLGRCRNRECSRQVKIDFETLVNLGYGRRPLPEVQSIYVCQRKPRCDLFWTETYPNGVPLQAYVGDTVELEVRCTVCTRAKRYKPEALIERFQSSGRGDGNTGIVEAGARIRGRCGCGAQSWRVEVIRPDPIEARRQAVYEQPSL